MKKLIAILLSLVCILSLVGCSQETTYQSTKIPNVSIRILNVSPSCATIIIKDTNDKPFVYECSNHKNYSTNHFLYSYTYTFTFVSSYLWMRCLVDCEYRYFLA